MLFVVCWCRLLVLCSYRFESCSLLVVVRCLRFVAWCFMWIVVVVVRRCWLLFVGWCVACCWLRVVRCSCPLTIVRCCFLFVDVRCLLLFVVRCVLLVV